jgi:alkylated DNA nucleotide flippase Atl1
MAATPRGKGIPWHRVLGAGGDPHSRTYASLQKRLLESERHSRHGIRINLKASLDSTAKKIFRRQKPATPATHGE